MLIKTKFEGYARDGVRLYPLDSGDSAPAQPTSTSSTQTSIPEYAKPYVEKMLGQTEALSATPYQTYDRERIAGFTPMQQQAFAGAQNMQVAPQLGVATDMAQQAGLRALGTNYQAGQFANQFQSPGQYGPAQLSTYQMGPAQQVGTQSFAAPNAAEAYMSPYMQSVVAMQQREAQRQSDIAGTQRGAQAVAAGAYGGGRQAIMSAEAARNLAQQKGDIQATGSQAAFQQAQQQFNAEQAARLQAQQANQQAGLTVGGQNLAAQLGVQQLGEQSRQYGAGLGMTGAQAAAQYGQAAQQLGEQSRQYGAGLGLQGLQTALQGAGQLGQLGGQQFQQGMDINKLQAGYGSQQQQQQQNIMSQQYQDFQNQQNYPYKQLGFMSDMLRGLPLSQSSQQMYQQPPSALSQVAGLGTAAYGISRMAEGGAVNQRPAGLAELAISRMA